MQKKSQVVSTLLDALPYIKKFHKQTIVIKYGGSAQIEEKLQDAFAQDIVLLSLMGIKIIIVHGGGNKITSYLDKLNIESTFIDGQRVTSKDAMEVAEMVLSGNINKSIVSMLNNHGANAIGISGKDLKCFSATSKDENSQHTGKITSVNKKAIKGLLREKFIPVIAPIANGDENIHAGYNINADLVASTIASVLNAKKVIFLTDTTGVLDKNKNLLSQLNFDDINKLKKDKTIYGGMIPKVDACLKSIKNGVQEAHIIDGRIEHSILLELLTKGGIGTIIKEH